MNLAEQVILYKEKGFTSEQAEIIVLMRLAAGVLFRAFPESFLLIGGAALLLFHQSIRHSGDLDLLLRTDQQPQAEALEAALADGLASAAEALHSGPLQFDHARSGLDAKLWVRRADGRTLFRIDLNRYGPVLTSEVAEHDIALAEDQTVKVKTGSRDFFLLQKAECFLLRKIVKARDAFDIRWLIDSGASLGETLKMHFTDTLMSHEIEPEDIIKRVEQVDEKRCRNELELVLPADVFESLAKQDFKPLRDSLYALYADWL